MERMIDEIIIGNERITMPLEDIPIGDATLDHNNPRIRYRLGLQTGKSLDLVILGMPEVKALLKDIDMNGGLRERIIVQKVGKKYKVLEGNCRTTCYQNLHKLKPDDQRWQKIPARILDADVSERKIATLLSDMHVAGKIVWEAHEKAGQVYRMYHELGMTYEEIASCMRQSKSTVHRLHNAYEFMVDKFLNKYPKEGGGKWSFFDELYRSKVLREHLKTDDAFGDKFCKWVSEKRVPKGADVRKLGEILGNPAATEKFESSKPEEAMKAATKVLEEGDPEHNSEFFKLLAKVRENCSNAAQVKEILRIRTDKNARKRVLDTYEALVDFMRLADVEPPKAK